MPQVMHKPAHIKHISNTINQFIPSLIHQMKPDPKEESKKPKKKVDSNFSFNGQI